MEVQVVHHPGVVNLRHEAAGAEHLTMHGSEGNRRRESNASSGVASPCLAESPGIEAGNPPNPMAEPRGIREPQTVGDFFEGFRRVADGAVNFCQQDPVPLGTQPMTQIASRKTHQLDMPQTAQ